MKKEISLLAKELRKNGKSIEEISRELNVSQSSVSRWCKNIELNLEQKHLLKSRGKEAAMRALQPWVDKNRAQKIQDIQTQTKHGMEDIGEFSNRDLYILGLGLYWGEGYKRGSQELGFTNSDPKIILAFMEWLEKAYGITKDKFIARLTINDRYSAETDRITKDWSDLTGISKEQFTSTSYISSKKISNNKDAKTYRGTLRLKVKSGTSLRRRILSSINEASAQISPNSRNTFS